MIRDPETAALRAELERLGVVVAPHSDHLCVRLPLFASVRVRIDEQGRLDCEPMFGPLPRTRALLLSTTVLTALAGGLLYTTGASPLALTVAFAGIMIMLASPVDAGPTLPTIAWQAQLLSKKEKTLPHRHNSTTFYFAFEGAGAVIIEGERLEYGKGDIFAVPAWTWSISARESPTSIRPRT